MNLITKLDDERLVSHFDRDDAEKLIAEYVAQAPKIASELHRLDAELRAALLAKENAERQLCAAREAFEEVSKTNFAGGTRHMEALLALRAALSASYPCRHESELKEGDYWMERARQSFANGTCPACFCTDEGPHNKGCYIAELETRADICTECNGGCPEKEHPVTRRYCEECWQHGFKKPIELLQARVEWAIRELTALGHNTAACRLQKGDIT
jgi:hypothetical protein